MRFADSVVGALAEKGYCVIQTFMTKRQRADAWHSGQEQERHALECTKENLRPSASHDRMHATSLIRVS